MRTPGIRTGPGRILSVVSVVAVAVALSACGGDDGDSQPEGQAQPAPATTQPEDQASNESGNANAGSVLRTEITTGDSQFGEVLFDGDQGAIYYFDKEKTSQSECYGDCARAWPPVLTEGEPEAAGGAQGRLLGTTERRDGSLQVTYDGRPLYYYVDDPAGQVLCHNVEEFGGLWLAVEPDGAPVT
jgi:predicted lipoprotein with Yx(FWY)xxD motif